MPARPPIMDNYRPVNTRPAPMLGPDNIGGRRPAIMQTQGPDNIGGRRPAIMQTQGPDNIGTQGPENLGFGRIGNDTRLCKIKINEKSNRWCSQQSASST
jgi:hypothetical protein